MAGPSPSEGEGPTQGEARDDRPRQSLRSEHKVRRRADYLRCYRRGRKRHGSLATVHFHPNLEEIPRLGITASRKVGKAVVRQRAKRRIREIFRRWPGRPTLAGIDIVVHLKPTVVDAPFSVIEAEIQRLLLSLPSKTSAGPRTRGSRTLGDARPRR